MIEALIKIENLTFYYPDCLSPALDGINLSVRQGEFIGITGPAGAGKSTLSFCFNGIIPHFQAGRVGGTVYFEGVPVGTILPAQIAAKIGSVFQDPEAQIVSMTVEEEVAFGLENLNFPRDLMLERIAEALHTVGISHLRQRSTASLSGGQKQKVVIAAVLAMRPQVLVLDEPTSELDPLGTEEVFQTLLNLKRHYGITIILFEQKIDQLAGYLDRLLVLDKGHIIADGKPSQVLARKDVFNLGIKIPQVAEFAMLWDGSLREVPVTLQEGLEFVRNMRGKGKV